MRRTLTRRLHFARGWMADLLRLPVAWVSINLQKTVWRWRRDGGPAPCQHASDSGCAFETHCVAARFWHRGRRLRQVCPDLRATDVGYLCSVDVYAVRSYWWRAVAGLAALALGLGGTGVVVTYVSLRATGLREFTLVDVAVPGRWGNIRRARSRTFCAQGLKALESRDFTGARLALNSAVESDLSNYDAAALLAMLNSLSPELGATDATFQWLLQEHPDRVAGTAVMFHDVLLAQGRPEPLAEFALWMALRDRAHAPLWVRSLMTALRLSGRAGLFARKHGAELRLLTPAARTHIAIEILIQEERFGVARLALQHTLEPGEPVYALLQIEQLLRLNDKEAAVVVKNSLPPLRAEPYSVGLQFWIEKQYGDDAFARNCFTKLAGMQLTDEQLGWVTALLVRAPDARSFAVLDAKMRLRAATSLPEQEVAGMWAAAVLCGTQPAQSYWAAQVAARARVQLPPGFAFDFKSLSPRQAHSVPAVLNLVQLPREVVFALLARVGKG